MKKVLLILLFLPCFVLTAYAEGITEQAGEEVNIYQVEKALPDELHEVSGTLTLDGSYDGAGALSRLWRRFGDAVTREFRADLKTALSVVAIALFCAVSAAACPESKYADVIHLAAAVTVSLMLAGGVDSMVSQAAEALEQLSDYSKAAMPAVFAAAAACGAVVSASARYGAVCLALDVMMSVSKRLTIPLIYAYLATVLCGGIFDNAILRAASKLIKRLATTVMSGLTVVFTAYIGITGLVTGSTDAAAVKTAKTVISAALPVVGSILSDAAASVLTAASIIKNSAGAFSLVAVCALCAGPFAALSVKVLLYHAAGAAAEMIPGERLSRLLNDIGSVMAMLLGLVGSFGVMLFFSFMAAIKVVTA